MNVTIYWVLAVVMGSYWAGVAVGLLMPKVAKKRIKSPVTGKYYHHREKSSKYGKDDFQNPWEYKK